MFLLSTLDETQFRERISEGPPIVRDRELCQAEFYVAVQALEDSDAAKARKYFGKAARLHEASLENEYELAQRENRRRKPVVRAF